ncbi:MAG: hypothetical protein LQ345_004085 [Seirophora villosa]|nr:MAG: hypothetical protein LQ345_004085 [Seirophora villosa]
MSSHFDSTVNNAAFFAFPSSPTSSSPPPPPTPLPPQVYHSPIHYYPPPKVRTVSPRSQNRILANDTAMPVFAAYAHQLEH